MIKLDVAAARKVGGVFTPEPAIKARDGPVEKAPTPAPGPPQGGGWIAQKAKMGKNTR